MLCKGVYNARKVIKTLWIKKENTLEVIIDIRRSNVQPKRPVQFSFSVQINDEDDCIDGTRTRCEKTASNRYVQVRTPGGGFRPEKCCPGYKCKITYTTRGIYTTGGTYELKRGVCT